MSHVTKYSSEFVSNIKNIVLLDFNQSTTFKCQVIANLRIIQEEFFSGDNLKLFKHLNSCKSLSTIIYFVFNIMSYVLESVDVPKEIIAATT
jgi:hypothetical protein